MRSAVAAMVKREVGWERGRPRRYLLGGVWGWGADGGYMHGRFRIGYMHGRFQSAVSKWYVQYARR